ncbi:MAG: TonB-dependent receptor [Flavobacteriales bacterium]|nr:TonB-dependent receptor [Flavobacteriales bacterium]
MKFPTLHLVLSIIAICLIHVAQAQGNSQTVRGTVIDDDTRIPLIGATVIILGSDPLKGSTTDPDGRFVITDVPTGRVDLQVRMLGYEPQLLANNLITSAKESVLEIRMMESVTELGEFEVKAPERKGEVMNDMALVSARRISVEETSRIAGGINDPARMVSAFPGVAGDPAGDNTIVVRGNSPKGVLWRLEGVEIPNPNHFADDGATGGPINVLNSDMIDDSEFYTGAFGAEYGNVYSAVFDMKLRHGNDREREYTLKAGVLGTDLTAEGPIPGLEGGSYLANYRYSSLALLDQAGIVDFQGVPKYTDAAFNIKLPMRGAGTFSVFGVGGKSNIQQEDKGYTGDTLFSNSDFGSRMGVVGLTHTRTIGANSFLYTAVSMSGNGSSTDYYEAASPGESPVELWHQDDLAKWTLRATSTLNTRINANHKLRSGLIISSERFRMNSASRDRDTELMETTLDQSGNAATFQAYTSWKWRWNEQWTMTNGVHILYYGLNDAVSVEPRVALRYQVAPGRAFTFGAGLHSKTEALMTYMAQDVDAQGNVFQPNRDLGLTRAAHAVLGFEQFLTEDIQLKAEAFYQYLYDQPVENDPNSAFNLSNMTGWFTTKPLVNAGVGYNTGVELGVERFFTRGYHFLVTGSVSSARYKALNGTWYDSRFNLGTIANVLAGKEWELDSSEGKDRTLMVGFRYSMQGGQYSTPIDLDASLDAGYEKEGSPAWSDKGEAIHKLDLVVSYRLGRVKASHEFKIDVQNVMNAQTAVYHYFDPRTETIQDIPQLALLPVLQYTLRF